MIGYRTLLLGIYVVVGCLPLVLVAVYPIRRDKPGGTGLVIILPGSSLWSLGTVLSSLELSWGISFAGNNVILLGASLSAIGWFVMIAEYTGLFSPTPRTLGVLALEPVLTQVAAWTRPFHQLLFTDTGLGPVFLLHTVIAYGLLLVGAVAIIDVITESSGLRRTQSIALFCSVLPPAVVELLNLFRLIPWFRFTPTPLAYGLSICIIAWSLFSARFLDLVPVARAQVLDTMSDPVVVIDEDGRVLESNPAAREFVGVGPDTVGMSCEEFFGEFPEAIDRLRPVESTTTELTVERNGLEYHFDVEVSPIHDDDQERIGRVLVFRDVSRLKRRERELREREHELDLMRQVQSRVLRHNIRNDITVIKGYNEVFVEDFDGETREMAELVIEKAEDLIAISHKARGVEELVERDQSPTEIALPSLLEELVRTHRERYPGVTFLLETPRECSVTAPPTLELGFANLIENAAEHNDSRNPTVKVRVETRQDAAIVTIRDNGPGVPMEELSVLEEGEETPLEHGSGIGLWIVEWIVDRTDTTIQYDSDERGTSVTVRIPT
jgi:PAS domain S-box-containing protein